MSGGEGETIMKRRVTVAGEHVLVEVLESAVGDWTASGVVAGRVLAVTGPTANRAASDWSVAADRDRTSAMTG
jgi:hypothetical protein